MKKQSHLVLHISCVYQRFLHVLHANGVDPEPSFVCATTSHSSICKFSITSIRPQDYVTISEPTKSMLHASAACCGSSEQIFSKSSTYYSGCCIQYAVITFSADTVTPQSVCSALHMCYWTVRRSDMERCCRCMGTGVKRDPIGFRLPHEGSDSDED